MAENIFKESFNIDDTDIFKGLEDVEKALIKLNKEANDLGTEFTETFKGANDDAKALSATLGATAENAAQANAKQAASIQNLTAANQSWYQSIKQTIGGTQIAGKSLSEWGEQAKGFASKIDLTTKAQTAASGAARIFGLALKATGIGALIGLVGGAILYFAKFQAGMDAVSRVVGGVGAVVNELVKRFVAFGSGVANVISAIGNLITLDFEGFSEDSSAAVSELSSSVSGLGTALYDAAIAGASLQQQMQDLRDITIKQSVFAAQQRVELEKFKQVMDDGTLSISARVQATKTGAVIEQNLAEQAIDRAEAALRIEKERIRLSTDPKNVDGLQALADAEIKNFEAVGELNKINFETEKKLRELRKEAAEEAKKQREKAAKELEDQHKALEKILKDIETLKLAIQDNGIDKELQAVTKRFDELQKLTTDGINKLTEISIKRELTPKEVAAFDELTGIYEGLYNARQSALLDVVTSFAEKDLEIEDEQQKARKALVEKDISAQKESSRKIFDLRNQQTDITEEQFAGYIEALKTNGSDEALIAEKSFDFDKLIQSKRLEAKLAFQESLLAIEEATGGAQVESIRLSIEKIKAEIDTLSVTSPEAGKKPKSIWAFLGLSDEAGEGVEKAAQVVIDSLGKIADARIKEAEAATKAAEDKVKAAEDALNKENDLALQGIANNSSLREIELSEAKKARDQALKEETKARKAQILLDSISQVSGLATASVDIFKSLAKIPFVGIPLAIGVIGLMFGAFAKSKADALKAVSAPKLRKGDKIQGRTHEQGGELRELEHNEQVVGALESENQDLFFQRMRQGRYRGLDLAKIAERQENPLSQAAGRIHTIEQRRAAVMESQHAAAMARVYETVGQKIVAAIEAKPVIYPTQKGYKVELKSNGVTEIKKVNFVD